MTPHETPIRTIRPEDAEKYLALLHQLDRETRFLLLEPGERQTTAEETRTWIESIQRRDHSTVFVAERGGELVGFLQANGRELRRVRHSLYLVVAIRQGYVGQGIGTRLFIAVEAWARERRIHRLHLSVMAHNERAIALYKKMGFLIEGLHRHALVVDGEYVDEYAMAKLLYEPGSVR